MRFPKIVFCVCSVLVLAHAAEAQVTISTVVGGGPDGVLATTAALGAVQATATDGLGNLYIAGTRADRVYQVDALGNWSVFAGNGARGFSGDGGPATDAMLSFPDGLSVGPDGSLYIADAGNNRIRRVDAFSGNITTVAGNGIAAFAGDGGPATNASINGPSDVAVDANGNVFIADGGNDRVRRVDGSTGIITTVAGNGVVGFSGDGGPGPGAALNFPNALAVDADGNAYIADSNNQRVRRWHARTGIITTVAGNGAIGFAGDGGPATNASLNFPVGLTVDNLGHLYFADAGNARVRRVHAATGIITTVAGNGGSGSTGDGGLATNAQVAAFVVAADSTNLFIGDNFNERIRRMNLSSMTIATAAGNGTLFFSGDGGPATNASLRSPFGNIAQDASGNLYIPDTFNHRVRKVDAFSGTITTVAGNGIPGFSGDGGPATNASLNRPISVALDNDGNIYFVDLCNNRVRRVFVATGMITTVAGSGATGCVVGPDFTFQGGGFSGDGGLAINARLGFPQGLGVDRVGNIFIGDTENNRVRKVGAATGIITTVAGTGVAGFLGDGGPAANARLNRPHAVAVHSSGNLFIGDHDNRRVRKVNGATGVITTIAGDGTFGFTGDGGPAITAKLGCPNFVAVDIFGNVFISEYCFDHIRRVDDATGIITTVAGNGIRAFSGDGGPPTSASLASPDGVAVAADGSGTIFITEGDPFTGDQGSRRIRQAGPF